MGHRLLPPHPPVLSAPQAVRRAVFIRTDRLGETMLNVPAIAALRQAYPKAFLAVMVQPELEPLLSRLPMVDQVLAAPVSPAPWWVRAFRLARRLQAHQFDLAVVSNPSKELHLAVWLAGIPCRVGYDRKWGGLLSHRVPDRKALGEHHEVEYNMRLLTALGISQSIPHLDLPTREPEHQRISQLLGQFGIANTTPLVAFHPWSSNPRKQWPAERFRLVAERLAVLPVVPVLVGGAEHQGEADVLMRGMASSVINLVGRLSLNELAACLQRARVLLTNDSGPMHVAAAVGTPVVALFGTADAGSHPRRWGPWGHGHTVIHKPLEHISVEEVVAAARRYVS